MRQISLETVLIATGAKQDQHDKAKWHTAQGVISVTGIKFMNWDLGFGGGGAIDLAMHLWNMDFKETVKWLWNYFPNAGHVNNNLIQPNSRLKLPTENSSNLLRVRCYLTNERKLSPDLVNFLIRSGSVYADKRGNAVFILLGKENKPVGAELKGTGQCHWQGMASGSRKDLGYFSISAPHAATIILCESAIDAVSCFSLQENCICISTVGARSNPLWLAGLIKKGYEIYCGYDSDTAGDKAAQAMMSRHKKVKRLRPTLKDWNEVLKAKL